MIGRRQPIAVARHAWLAVERLAVPLEQLSDNAAESVSGCTGVPKELRGATRRPEAVRAHEASVHARANPMLGGANSSGSRHAAPWQGRCSRAGTARSTGRQPEKKRQMFASKSSLSRLLSFGIGLAAFGFAFIAPSRDAHARDDADGSSLCYEASDGYPVCIGSTGGGGSGTGSGGASGGDRFVGAYVHDDGSWSEVYNDDDGSGYWWVTHNSDGSSTIGDAMGGSANYITGPKFDVSVPGALKKRPAGSGKPWSGPAKPKPSTARTGTLTGAGAVASSIPLPTARGATPEAKLYFVGTGKCDVGVVVSKHGKLGSGVGVKRMQAGLTKIPVRLPSAAGTYKVDLVGEQGCFGGKGSVEVKVTSPRIAIPGVIKK